MQRARRSRDDERGLRRGDLLPERRDGLRLVVGVHDADALHAARAGDALDRGGLGLLPQERHARAGVVLVAGHRGDAVVDDDERRGALVVDRVQQPRDAAVEEGRVADDADDGLPLARLLHAVRHREARAHAQDGVRARERRERAQRVAADVARDDHVEAREREEEPAVRAAGAERRRAGREVRRLRDGPGQGRQPELREERAAHLVQARGREFAAARDDVLAVAREAERADVLLEDGVALVDHEQAVDRRGEGAQQRVRERPPPADLEDRGVREDLRGVQGGDAVRDDAEGAPRAADHGVEVRLRGLGRLRVEALLDLAAQDSPVDRQRHELRHVALEARLVARPRLALLDERTRVRHAGRGAQDDGAAPLLGELEALHDEVARLGGVARLEAGDLRQARVVARVLLGLGGILAGVVRDDDHHPAADSDVGKRHQRVGRDVEPDELHRDERARAGDRGAGGRLERDLLVGRPFGVDAAVPVEGEVLENFGGGRPGVAERGRHAALECAPRDRLVSGEQVLHGYAFSKNTRLALPSGRGSVPGA